MWRSRWRCVIKPAYSVSFLLSINIFLWQNVLYFLDAPRTFTLSCCRQLRSSTLVAVWLYPTATDGQSPLLDQCQLRADILTAAVRYTAISLTLVMAFWILAQIFVKNCIDFHVLLSLFIVSVLGMTSSGSCRRIVQWRSLLWPLCPSAPVRFYLIVVNMCDGVHVLCCVVFVCGLYLLVMGSWKLLLCVSGSESVSGSGIVRGSGSVSGCISESVSGSGSVSVSGTSSLCSVLFILENPKLRFLQRAHYVCISYGS